MSDSRGDRPGQGATCSSCWVRMLTALPLRPSRAVRPAMCTYDSRCFGRPAQRAAASAQSKLVTTAGRRAGWWGCTWVPRRYE